MAEIKIDAWGLKYVVCEVCKHNWVYLQSDGRSKCPGCSARYLRDEETGEIALLESGR